MTAGDSRYCSTGGRIDGRLTVAMLSSFARGHLLPMCSLIEEMSSRGHEVLFYYFDIYEEDIKGLVEKAGAKFVPIPGILKDKSEGRPPLKDKKKYLRNLQVGVDYLKAEWSKSRPSVVVADFFGVIAFRAAYSLGIPTVMNCPAAVSMLESLMLLPVMDQAFNLGGITLLRPKRWSLSLALHFVSPVKEWSAGARLGGSTGMVLVNSFRGLEPNGLLPSNFILTGPLLAPRTEITETMAHSHPDLQAWMDGAADLGVPVVYVSTGSLLKPNQWEVETIFAGLGLASCRVVWSLPEDSQEFLPPGYDKGKFWIAAWLPQPAILEHRATKLCVSHCGFGGTLESITAGVPIYAIPYFGDQPANARLLVDAGAALLLPKRIRASITPPKAGYREGDFTAESVASGVHRLVNEPSFTEAVRALRVQAAFQGGRKKAGDSIEFMGRCPDSMRAHWENPMLRSCMGHWTDCIVWPLLCTGAVAGAVFLIRSHCFRSTA